MIVRNNSHLNTKATQQDTDLARYAGCRVIPWLVQVENESGIWVGSPGTGEEDTYAPTVDIAKFF
ncbi:hypothetical protein ACVLB3_000770 [Pseudarthrobacter sp. PvP022]